nr:MAG TPA: hypothetical protein [Caudoviricetes sp.]
MLYQIFKDAYFFVSTLCLYCTSVFASSPVNIL